MNYSVHPDVLTIVLAGGEGTRLMPLTSMRCKPAVMFAGRYRLIDIPISNALNANFNEIYVLSQFLACSLDEYLHETYPPNGSRVETLKPNQGQYYSGTADAVRKNLSLIRHFPGDYVVILSGDQVYNMDLEAMLEQAKQTNADLTIATLPVNQEEAKRMGVMKIGKEFKIKSFAEKPTDEKVILDYAIAPHISEKYGAMDDLTLLGSMGIYIFKKDVLIRMLSDNAGLDFGKDIIPALLNERNCYAYIFDGYWEDIGTISSFYEANLKVIDKDNLSLDLNNESYPIHTQAVCLPAPCIQRTLIDHAILCDGSVIRAKEISNSMIGMRSIIDEGTVIQDTIVMGNTPLAKAPATQIGKNCRIEKAILDESAVIGDNVRLTNAKHLTDYHDEHILIKNGIIIVKTNTHVPSGYSI